MKRIHLFEFEDFSWFPDWIRDCMTSLMKVMHNFLNTAEEITPYIKNILKETGSNKIVDMCSGGGGPMIDVYFKLTENGENNLILTLTDLFPDKKTARDINEQFNKIRYLTEPFPATEERKDLPGVRTMISSFHHMKPEDALRILQSVQESRQPICIFEISDNSFPRFLWWFPIPINFIMCLFITPLVRPLKWKLLVFTYLIPVIPLFFAWDGAVSNARTYTINDIDRLLEDIKRDDYYWEKGIIKGKSRKIYLLGRPAKSVQVYNDGYTGS